MADWTPELEAEVALMTPREFDSAYPGLFTRSAIHIKRRRLRDLGVSVMDSPIGRPADPILITVPQLPEEPTDDELWKAYDAMYDYQLKHDQSKALPSADINVQTNRPFGVVFISDMHLGNKGVDTRRLREDIELITTCDRLRVYMGGDWADNFVIQALASVHRDEALVNIEVQFEVLKAVLRLFGPKQQLLAIGTGNHDAWHKKVSGIDPTLAFLKDVPALHTAEDTYLNMTVGTQEYIIYRKHRPNRTTQYNEGHGVQHAFRFGERPFDVGIMEHHHTPHLSNFHAHGQLRWAVRTGSYKIRDNYAREAGFVNSQVGTPVLVFFPNERNIVPFMNIVDAIEFLEAV